MPIDQSAPIVVTAYGWVPEVVYGNVRDVRVRWACEEAGIAYAEELVDVRAKPEGFERRQPWRQVPALRDGSVEVFESGAILLHLAEDRPFLLPASGQPRAEALSWAIAALNTVEPVVMDLVNAAFFAKGKEWSALRLPEIQAFLARRLGPVSDRLNGREWLAGSFSIADILMIHILQNASDFDDALTPFPKLVDYVARGFGRPAYKRALADHLSAFDRFADRNEEI